jgi:uncharacterized membrane protein
VTEDTCLDIGIMWTMVGVIFLIWSVAGNRGDLLLEGIAFLTLGLIVIYFEINEKKKVEKNDHN